MKGMTAFVCISDIDLDIIEESMSLFSRAKGTFVRRQRTESPLARFFGSGWGVAIICAVVSLSVLSAIVWAGWRDPVVPPLDTVGSEGLTESEEETVELVPTEGLYFSGNSYGDDCTVCGHSRFADVVVIPSYYEGRPVVGIGVSAFSEYWLNGNTDGKKPITEVILPDTLVRIWDRAFFGCHSLKSIHIPASVTMIHPSAFQECTGLERITVDENNPVYHAEGNCLIETATGTVIAGCRNSVIPEDGSVKAISEYAFYKNTTLTEINIPASVTEIPKNGFYGCFSLAYVDGGEGLVVIGDHAFEMCTELTSFTFSETVKHIGTDAFRNCHSLTEVVLPRVMTYLGCQAFMECPSLIRIELPASVESLCPQVMESSAIITITVPEGYTNLNTMLDSCKSLTTVYLPSTLTKINDMEFIRCYALTDIYFNGTLEQWLAITQRDQSWMASVGEWTLHCTDGVTQWRYDRGYGMRQVNK